MSEHDEYIELVTLIRAGREEAYGELYEKTVTGYIKRCDFSSRTSLTRRMWYRRFTFRRIDHWRDMMRSVLFVPG